MRAMAIREGGSPSVLTFGDAPYLRAEEGRVLVHAAADSTGALVVQWLRHLGATVIGTVPGPARQVPHDLGRQHAQLSAHPRGGAAQGER
jgi:NADPH:quinone reductase-like Zn-dependent oxidoreductase